MRNNTRRPLFPTVVLLTVLLGGPACAASPRGRVYVRVGPPAAITDVRTAAPGPRHVWVSGYHRWDGSRYVWVPGHWVVPPAARAAWVPGRWHKDRRGWYFVDGHWR